MSDSGNEYPPIRNTTLANRQRTLTFMFVGYAAGSLINNMAQSYCNTIKPHEYYPPAMESFYALAGAGMGYFMARCTSYEESYGTVNSYTPLI